MAIRSSWVGWRSRLLLAAGLVAAIASCGDDGSDDRLQFAPDTLPSAQVGVAYTATIRVTNAYTPVGDISVSRGELPPGLELTYTQIEDSAQVAGIPVQAGTHGFTVAAWCMGTMKGGQTGDKTYSIEVIAGPQKGRAPCPAPPEP